jgi:SAM-dependent methyltransferase
VRLPIRASGQVIAADPDVAAASGTSVPPARRLPRAAGSAYGRALAYLDAPTLALWSGANGIGLHLSQWYARAFGFPELAAHRRFGTLRDLLRRNGGGRVLDLGAGNGLYSVGDAIDRPGTTHVLADVSLRHMSRATATGHALGLPMWGIACSAAALPLATASLDSVLLVEVLQFIDDDEAAIQEVARVLRPGGAWLCEQEHPPADSSPVRTEEARLQRRRAGYSPEALTALAERAGLSLEHSQMVSGPMGRWWEGFDGRMFRRSRLMHFVLFPLIHLLARLSTPAPVHGTPGTVLYLFRKTGIGPKGVHH